MSDVPTCSSRSVYTPPVYAFSVSTRFRYGLSCADTTASWPSFSPMCFPNNISDIRRNKINIHLYIYYKLGEHRCGLRFRLINRFILAINVLRCVKPITLALAVNLYIYRSYRTDLVL